MVSLLGGAARTLSSEFEASLNGIERTLAERGQALISEFQTRAEALDTGTQKLNAALEARARQINETLVERAREIAHTFAESKETLSAMIDQGKTQIGADMADIVTSTSSMLEARASDFAGRMEAARHVVSRSFDTDIQRLADARVGIEEAVENHSRKLSESRDRMAAAMQADLAKFAEGRAGIDAAVTNQVQKLAEGRNLISRALEEDLRKVNESRAAIDASLGSHLERLEDRPQPALPGSATKTPGNSCKPVRSLMKWSPDMSASWPKAATSCRAPWKPISASWPTAAPASTGWSPARSRRSPKAAPSSTKALENDIIGIKSLIENHSAKLAEDRDRTQPGRWRTTCPASGACSTDHSSRLADDRGLLSQTLEADLAKLAESRSSIDGLVAGQVEKLAEGRDILKRALEADLNTIKGVIAGHSERAGGRSRSAFQGTGSRSAECEQPDTDTRRDQSFETASIFDVASTTSALSRSVDAIPGASG